MSSVQYIGGGHRRIIKAVDWARHGITAPDVTWSKTNGWSIPQTDFSEAQLEVLRSMPDILTDAPDGPRQGGPVPVEDSADTERLRASDILTADGKLRATRLPTHLTTEGLKTFVEENAPEPTAAVAVAPAYVGERTRSWDPVRHVYNANPNSLHLVRAALSKALSGGFSKVLCLGDSSTAGAQAVPNTSDWPTRLRQLLGATSIPLTDRWHWPTNGIATFDNAWSFVGAWNGRLNSSYSYVFGASATNTATLKGRGTTMELTFFSNAAISVQYVLDGGAVQEKALVPNELTRLVVNGLSDAEHTVTINKKAGNSSTLWVGPGRFRHDTGLSLANAGISGSKASDWLPNAMGDVFYNPFKLSVGLETPDLVLLTLGGNEILGDAPATPADLTTRIRTIGNAIKATGSGLVLGSYLPINDTEVQAGQGAGAEGQFNTWLGAIYTAAEQLDVMLIDQSHDMPSNPTLIAEGWIHADKIHPTALGYAHMARRYFHGLQLAA